MFARLTGSSFATVVADVVLTLDIAVLDNAYTVKYNTNRKAFKVTVGNVSARYDDCTSVASAILARELKLRGLARTPDAAKVRSLAKLIERSLQKERSRMNVWSRMAEKNGSALRPRSVRLAKLPLGATPSCYIAA